MKVGLCLLTWNEVEGCKHDIPGIDFSKFDQVFALDGGSSDGTVEWLQEYGVIVYQQEKKGYNQAYIEAFSITTCDALIMFHPKGTVRLDDLYNFRKYFDAGYSLIVASRIVDGGTNEEDSKFLKPRKWFVMLLAITSYVLWGRKKEKMIWDVLHGFRGMRKDDFALIQPLETGLSIDLEMVVRSYRKGLRWIEFPTHEKRRYYSRTHFKALPTGGLLLKYLWYELFRDSP